MGLIKFLFGVVILVVIVAGGFWLAGIYTPYVSPEDEKWVMLNGNLPGAAHDWACSELRARGVKSQSCIR
jgi:hypothetical protein